MKIGWISIVKEDGHPVPRLQDARNDVATTSAIIFNVLFLFLRENIGLISCLTAAITIPMGNILHELKYLLHININYDVKYESLNLTHFVNFE